MKPILWIITVALLAGSAMAQSKPDFSGRWTIEPEATAPAGAGRTGPTAGSMGSGWGPDITIRQDASRITVEYAFFVRSDLQPPLKFVFALDGSETKNSVMMGRGIQAQSSKTHWEGNKLIITTEHAYENPANGQSMTTKVVQSLLLDSPTSLVVETVRGAALGGPPSTTRVTYKKSQ